LTLVDIILLLGFVETIVLFLYAVRWYIFSYVSLRVRKNQLLTQNSDGMNHRFFISILLPIYNEPNVIDRLLKACTSFNSPKHEIIVIDDSDDKQTGQKLRKWGDHPLVKIVSRASRRGWKGGALNSGLEKVDPRSSHVLVFDADFVPPSDLVSKFVKRFQGNDVVAVQGYQRHDLNANENWVTKGVRVWHSMYNMVELNGKENLGLFLPLTGGVFMIRTDVLKKLNFEEVTDEDWNLTVRLYENGYRIDYDPDLVASGECPNTFRKLLSQQTRWAEGHTRTFREHFWKVLRSKYLNLRQKIDFLITGYCFLHTVMVTLLMGAILIVAVFPSTTFPVYLSQIQTILLFASVPAAISASFVALLLENSKKDFKKIGYTWLINFLIVPAIAYAALKGLFIRKGKFNRTFKTGKITKEDTFVDI
jgi:cellulose synthase/poly-beta-1,6-N-acetylglucosamine synthase-like glycosyltransferase